MRVVKRGVSTKRGSFQDCIGADAGLDAGLDEIPGSWLYQECNVDGTVSCEDAMWNPKMPFISTAGAAGSRGVIWFFTVKLKANMEQAVPGMTVDESNASTPT